MYTSETVSTPMNREAVRTRQRQVLDIIYRLGEASVADVQRALREDVSYSAVRSVLRTLEDKGLLKHRARDLKYVYSPVVPKSRASRSALSHLVRTFFDDDPAHAMKALLDVSRARGYDVDYAALKRMIDQARREGR
jgi:predicted transcriptional regulator